MAKDKKAKTSKKARKAERPQDSHAEETALARR
jgi:hypothetical protein